jgi:lycopene beta-cyclase
MLLVGAGLQNALIALAVLDAQPKARVMVLEQADRPCGNHTWSFHDGDVPHALRPLMDEVAEHRWPDYDVRFPSGERRVSLGYASVSSAHLASLLERRLAASTAGELRTGVTVEDLDATGVTLDDGARIDAALVVDGRGARPDPSARTGYQKFVGLEIELEAPHGLVRPLLMDATVEQVDGFRFLYVLPFSPTRLLVEDTVFSSNPDLDVSRFADRARAQARGRGWEPKTVVRDEQGVLPMPWRAEGPALQTEGPLRAGYRGNWFHPATGFSMPQALRLAALVAAHVEAPERLFVDPAYRRLVKRERKQARFARFLNRLLFTGLAPTSRLSVFERFYRHPDALIERFYAGQPNALDRTRMLVGRPPKGFSLRGALVGSAQR